MTFDETVTRAEYGDLLHLRESWREVGRTAEFVESNARACIDKLTPQIALARDNLYAAQRHQVTAMDRLDTIEVELVRRKGLTGLERAFPALVEATSVLA